MSHGHHKHQDHQAKKLEEALKEFTENEMNEEKEIPSQEAAETSKAEARAAPQTTTVAGLELESLRRENADFKDKYLRVLAESENARKRLQKEKQETIQYALQNVIVDFLTPIDHMENALSFTEQMSDDVKHWAIGFQMILTQFKDVLSNNGVTPFPSEGKTFDPHRHEAIEAIETTELPPGMVVKENLRGYIMGDKVIRPARVTVSKKPAEEQINTEQ